MLNLLKESFTDHCEPTQLDILVSTVARGAYPLHTKKNIIRFYQKNNMKHRHILLDQPLKINGLFLSRLYIPYIIYLSLFSHYFK